MSNNRELSQLASLITVDDSDRSLGINTSVGIGTTNPQTTLYVVGDAYITGVITATNITGTATTATKLATPRSFEITGDVVASPIFFDGTANVSLAATIQPNSVGLGTDTTGDYVTNISGTSNQITVTGGTGESSTPTLSVPNQFTAPQDVTVTRDLQVNRNLNVNGNITIGGTSATLFTSELKIFDPDIVLGFRTDALGNDVSTDNTADHGGVAIASTEGTPLVNLFIAGIETNPATYKKIMWFKSGTFSGLGTDAWLSNYAVGIGSTQVPNGVRLASGAVQFTDRDLISIRNINASGIITTNNLNATGVSTITDIRTNTNINSSGIHTAQQFVGNISAGVGTITNITGTNLNYTGVSTLTDIRTITGINASGIITAQQFVGNINAGVGTITNITGTNLNYTGISTVTNITGTNLNYTGVSTITDIRTNTNINSSGIHTAQQFVGNINAGVGTITNITGTNLNYTGVSTITDIRTNTNINSSGIHTAQQFVGNISAGVGTITNITGTNLNYTGVSTITDIRTNTNINSSGIHTAQQFVGNISAGIATISVNSSSDALRITQTGSGNALVVEDETNPDATPFVINASGSVGIGTTNPTEELHLFNNQNSGTSVLVTNNDTGTAALASFRVNAGSTASISLISHGSGRTSSRLGQVLASMNEITSSTGNGILFGTQNATPLILGTNDVEIVRITSSGNVGIGTTNPLGTLQVNSGTSAVVVSAAGSVGIGTTNPERFLDINKDINGATDVRIRNNNTGTSAFTSFSLVNDGSSIGLQNNSLSRTVSRFGSVSGGWGEILLSSGNGIKLGTTIASPVVLGTNNTEALRIDSSQRVGIGTTNPLGTLQVGAAGTSAVVVSAGGSIGIGRTNPTRPLHISKDAASSTVAQILVEPATGSNAALIQLQNNSASNFNLGLLNSSGAISGFTGGPSLAGYIGLSASNPLLFVTNNTERVRITSDGSVGIGTTNPTAALTIGTAGIASDGRSQIYLNGATSNRIDFNTNGIATPTIVGTSGTTRSAGTKIVLYPGAGASQVDFAFGIEGNHAWQSVPTTNSTQGFKWYAGTTELARLRGDGNLGIGTTNPPSKFTVTNPGLSGTNVSSVLVDTTITDTNADLAFGQKINTIISGSTAATGNREQGSLYLVTDSSNTGGDTTNEHRVYSIFNDVRVSGDSDFVTGIYNDVTASHSSGTINAFYGDYNLLRSTATSGILQYYASYSIAQPISGSTGAITTLTGIRSRVNFSTGAASTATNVFGVWANLDNDAGLTQSASGTTALFYGSYDVTTGYTNPYGVYIETLAADNYFAGNVGIGITNPGNELQVAGPSAGIRITDTTGAVGDMSSSGWLISETSGISVFPPANSLTISNGSVTALTLDGGNVGVNTILPGAELDVQGNIRIRDTTADSTFTSAGNLAIKDNAGDPFISFHEADGTRNAYIQSTDTTGFFFVQEDAFPLTIRTEQAQGIFFETSNTERMRITGVAGDVGIGTTNPGTKLHIHESNTGTTPSVRIQNSAGTIANNAVLLELFFSGDADVSGVGSAHYVRFRDNNNNPTGQISGASATTVLYATASDYRLKEDITPISNGIEQVMQFKPSEFTWKQTQTRSQGFIAHEVQEVLPEAVVGAKDAVDEEGNMIPQMIDPSKMVVVLTAALQEAIQRIQYLESVVGIGSS